jgi:hypothetical protein
MKNWQKTLSSERGMAWMFAIMSMISISNTIRLFIAGAIPFAILSLFMTGFVGFLTVGFWRQG